MARKGCGCLSAVIAFMAIALLGTAFFRKPVQELRPGIVDVLDGQLPQGSVDEAAAILEDVGCGNLEVMDAKQPLDLIGGTWSMRGMVGKTQVNLTFVDGHLWRVEAAGVGNDETETYRDRDDVRWTRHGAGQSMELFVDGEIRGVLDAANNEVASP